MTPSRARSLRRTAVRAVASLAAAGTLTVAGTTAAHADAWTHVDPAGDVVQFDLSSESGELTPAPSRERGDVRRVRIAHHAQRVVVRFTMRKAVNDHSLFYAIRTPRAEYQLERSRAFGSGTEVTLHKNEKRTKCSGIDWDIDRDPARVTVSLPRKCLGDPRWVRVGAGVLTFTDRGMFFADEALRTGLNENGNLRYSPRLYRA